MNSRSVWGILTAAGIGARMHSKTPKQYLQCLNKPIIEHTLNKLANISLQGLVVVVAEHDIYWSKLCISMPYPVITVRGGKERCHSVYNGVCALQSMGVSDDAWVLVHDAARPCVQPLDIQKLVSVVKEQSVGGLLAIPVTDTLKSSQLTQKESVCAHHTVDRHGLWQAQTPQLFPLKQLTEGLKQAIDQGITVTDEASVLERMGYRPQLIEGSKFNIKITTEEDLWLAEVILSRQLSVYDITTIKT